MLTMGLEATMPRLYNADEHLSMVPLPSTASDEASLGAPRGRVGTIDFIDQKSIYARESI